MPLSEFFYTLEKKQIFKRPTPQTAFIVFEGLDGSGQTTQANLLKDFFVKRGLEVVLTKEPTIESPAGKKIREILNKKIKTTPEVLQNLFVEDRKEHLKNLIIPSLKQGKIVISDRYFFSTFAYGSSEGIEMETLIEKNRVFLMPDITFILKVSAKTCISRIEERGTKKTLFEKEKKLAEVLEKYMLFPSMFENVFLIDGEKKIEEVFECVKNIIISKF